MKKDGGKQDPVPNGGFEMEIKLVGAGLDAESVFSDPAVLGAAKGEAETVALHAVYFDTPDSLLHRAKAALRVRAEGERFLVTAKTSGDPDGFSRLEVEAPAANIEPDRTLLLACLPPKLAEKIGDAELRPVFRTEIERRKRLLEMPTGKVELALDRGQILADGRSEPVAELELELKSGTPITVWRLARELGSRHGLRPSLRSKSERGYALARNMPAPGVRGAGVTLPDGTTLDEAVDRILRTVFRQILQNQPAAQDGRDAEGLHQFRVGLRRLRAVLKLLAEFGPDPQRQALREQAKTLMAPLNDARALDVFLAQTLPDVRTAMPALEGLDALEEKAGTARERAYEQVRSQIADPGTGQFELSLGVWIEEKGWRAGASEKALAWLAGSVEAFAARAVNTLHAAVLKRGRKFRSLPPPKRHKVRIAVKNLRYVADLLAEALDGGKPFGRGLEKLQNRLGAANDLAGIDGLVRPLLDEVGKAGQIAGGAVLGWAAAGLDAEQDSLLAAWKRFKKTPLP